MCYRWKFPAPWSVVPLLMGYPVSAQQDENANIILYYKPISKYSRDLKISLPNTLSNTQHKFVQHSLPIIYNL